MPLPSRPVLAGATLLVALATLGCGPGAVGTVAPPVAQRRAIVVSFDALSESRLRASVDRAAAPTFYSLFERGACAAYARPAMPSLTAASHASLWTGAYGDVNGVAANDQPILPRDEHALTELASGFSAAALRAEPIWVTAGLAGLRVAGHHPTQAPGVPGYAPVTTSDRDTLRERLRARAADALARPNVQLLNGYNRDVTRDLVLTERTHRPRVPNARWWGLDRLGRVGTPPREIAWRIGRDSAFALFYGAGRAYTHVVVSARERDASAGVIARAVPADTTWPVGRPLARHFSEPLVIPLDGGGAAAGRVVLRVRLFALAPDASSYLLFQPMLNVVESNHPRTAIDYAAAIGGWVGNSASWLYEDGDFGRTVMDGGDGTAEARYLETAELLTRQSMRGVEWMWQTYRPALLLDYFSLIDNFEHVLYGYVDPASPRYDARVAARVQELRRRAWALADLRLAHLRALVRASGQSRTALFVSGDHGMRATWRVFRPNVALAHAGLLTPDTAAGRDSTRVDLARTRALSPNGYWVTVNRAAWKGGVVGPGEEAWVLDEAEQALRTVRGADGAPVVTRIFRAAEHDSLGLGGPVGGDLYYEVAPGYRWTSSTRGAVIDTTAEADAGHGYPSVSPDMYTVFCGEGMTFPSRRFGPARTIDVAPTVAEWLGIEPPPTAKGRSMLREFGGGR
jgi:predicted AlkP superfamily phosphohydrolase/phosphomutase